MEATPIPLLKDNYAYLIEWDGNALVIDAGDAAPIVKIVEERGLNLLYVLSTHHHFDHVDGNLALKQRFGCQVVGPDDPRVPGLDIVVRDGETFSFFDIIGVPAHTTSHIAYYLKEKGWLFTGDCLFNGGAGRLFEGTAEQMMDSLSKLTALPEETLVYSGHEYTLANLTFAHQLEPENVAVERRLKQLKIPSVPSTLKEELETNPFLRIEALQSILGSTDKVGAFQRLRDRRSSFAI